MMIKKRSEDPMPNAMSSAVPRSARRARERSDDLPAVTGLATHCVHICARPQHSVELYWPIHAFIAMVWTAFRQILGPPGYDRLGCAP